MGCSLISPQWRANRARSHTAWVNSRHLQCPLVDFDAIILGVGPFLAENKGSLSLPRMRSRQIQSRYEHTIYAKIAHRKRSPTPAG